MGNLCSGKRLRALLADASGAAAIEAALTMPMLLLTMAGLVDGSRAIVQFLQVKSAAHAGAEWARENGWNAAGVQTAVQTATTLAVQANPAPTQFWGCATPSNGVQVTSKTTKCSGDPPGSYVKVNAQAAFQTWAPWPGMTWPAQMTASAIVRVD